MALRPSMSDSQTARNYVLAISLLSSAVRFRPRSRAALALPGLFVPNPFQHTASRHAGKIWCHPGPGRKRQEQGERGAQSKLSENHSENEHHKETLSFP